MNRTVSVIIPIYNPGSPLRRCLDSLTSQSYSNIEIILINDGSTDGSEQICADYVSKDNRIVYIKQDNAGVSAARNRGINTSSGEYLCFVDSDDYVDTNYVQLMVDAVGESNADIVIQGLKQIKNGQIVNTERFDNRILQVSNLNDNQFDDIFYYCGPYCKLFKTSIVRSEKIYFPIDLSYGEDAVFYHAYLGKCRTIELLSATSYNYMIANEGALSTKILSPDKFWQNQSNRRGAYRKLKEKFGLSPVLSKTEQTCKLIGIGGMLNSIFKSGINDASVCHYLSLMYSDEEFKTSELKPSGVYHKCILSLIKSNNRLSRWILKMIYR